VDLDPKAVEIAQLNLLLQISEKGEKLPLLQNNIKVGNSLIDDPSISDKAFKWESEFPEIMKEGGFDIIIGNPPYGKGIKDEINQNIKGVKDTYTAFMIKASNILKNKGFLGFIVPQSWETGERYLPFRKEIFSKLSIWKIINLPFDTFEEAYVDTCIVILKKEHTQRFFGYTFPKNKKINRLLNIDPELKSIDTKDIFEDKFLRIILNSDIRRMLENYVGPKFTPLGNISKSTIGILASRYVITDEKKDNYWPFLIGNVYRYRLDFSKFRYIDMSMHKDEYLDYYKGKRILIRRIISRQDRIMATIVEEEFVNKKDLYSFKIIDSAFLPEYILALLNSKLLSFFYIHTSAISTKDDFRQTTLAELRRLPIANIDLNEQKRIAEFVKKLLELNAHLYSYSKKHTEQEEKIQKEIEKIENNLDRMIYMLYNLKDEEIKEIEKYFEKTK
jgi:hypothetical protein